MMDLSTDPVESDYLRLNLKGQLYQIQVNIHHFYFKHSWQITDYNSGMSSKLAYILIGLGIQMNNKS